MRLRNYDNLRSFAIVAKHSSLASASKELFLTKGAISHQIRQLENDLGFKLFERHARGITLTDSGRELLHTANLAFEQIEQKVSRLAGEISPPLTIGVTTYFASRWLSPRLMDFMRDHPDIRLRIQPMIDLLNLRDEGIDVAIRWGDGNWTDCLIEELFNCPAWPTGNRQAMDRVSEVGLETAFREFTLLRDREDSNAWRRWYEVAGLETQQRTDTLIIPDPNVRVQAVMDGQGVALDDELIAPEIDNKTLFRLSEFELSDYGYFLAYESSAQSNPNVAAFLKWIKNTG